MKQLLEPRISYRSKFENSLESYEGFVSDQVNFIGRCTFNCSKNYIETYGLGVLFSISLPGYIFEYDLFGSKQELEYIPHKEMYLLIKPGYGGISDVHVPKFFNCDDERETHTERERERERQREKEKDRDT